MKIEKLLVKKIKEYEHIIIAKHLNPDWDAQGSAMGLAWIIKDSFKHKKIYVVGERLNEDTHFSADELTDEIISQSLMITVDTAAKKLIDFDRTSQVREIFKIDHHLNVDPYGTYNFIDETSIANTQVVTLWAEKMKLSISQEAATNLYKGLITDSGRFLFPRTGMATYQAAMILYSTGINLEEIHNELYVSPLKVKQWQNYAFSKMKITKKGVAYLKITPEDYDKFGVNKTQIKAALGVMSGIIEISVWALICQYADGEIRVSLRSREYDVNSVARNYRGGGHRLASGAKLEKMSESTQLIKDLEKLIS